MDDDVVTSAPVTDNEIIDEIRRDRNTTSLEDLHYSSETEEDEQYNDSSNTNVTTTEAFNALKTIRRYVMQTENSLDSLEAVDKLDDLYKRTVSSKTKQLQITDFFKL